MEIAVTEQELDRRAKILIVIVALLQGIGLYCLHSALEQKLWPINDLTATTVLATFLLVVPTFFTLSYRSDYPQGRYWLLFFAIAIVYLWLPWYSSQKLSLSNNMGGQFYLVPLGLLLAFIILFFLKATLATSKQSGAWMPSYESLFGYSWHNFLSFVLAWLFTLIFWLILVLWGALFKIVDITLFYDTFQKSWFLYPVLSLAFAYGVIMFRTKINAVGAVQRILRALISMLLPLLLFIALMFITVLPFTGVNLIWDKGYGSDTILGFVGLSLFFFNAVYQDGKEPPYRPLLNFFCQYSMIALIVLLALSAYGMYARVAQYGLTTERILAIILIAIMFSYLVLYAAIAVFKRFSWPVSFGNVNTLLALVISGVIFLLFTPVLDPSRLSVNSQLARLDAGLLPIEKVDFKFLARNGKHGKNALESLKLRNDVKSSADISRRIDSAIKSKGRGYMTHDEISLKEAKGVIQTYPVNTEFESAIWALFSEEPYTINHCFTADCALLRIDLNGDSVYEYVLFNNHKTSIYLKFFIRNQQGKLQAQYSPAHLNMSFTSLLAKLESSSFSLASPQWKNLKIGDETINTPSNALDQ